MSDNYEVINYGGAKKMNCLKRDDNLRIKIFLAICIWSTALWGMGYADAEAADSDKGISVAYFASSSQNSFNQAVYEGIQKQAEELGGVSTTIFDGKFDASIQFNQIEDAVTTYKYDAFIIFANDTVGIVPAVEDAIQEGIEVVAAFFPIGPDLTTLSPQVEGLAGTVGRPPADGAKLQAEAVIDYCKNKETCNVAIIIGQKIYPFDNLRYQAYLQTFKNHKNISIIATLEGNYSPAVSMKVMQDTLQKNVNIDVVLSNADQHLVGAEIALEDAGYKVEDVYLIGNGASKRGVIKIREGKWDASLALLPFTTGELALQTVVNVVKGKYDAKIVNMDTATAVPAIITRDYLIKHPEFVGEWE